MERLRIGVIGAGRIAAGSHLPCLTRFPDVEVVLCEVDAARLATVAAQYGIAQDLSPTTGNCSTANGSMRHSC